MTGIDISGVQNDDVPGDWEFIVVKLSEGMRNPNPRFAAQWANAARTTRGVYHYAIVGGTSPQNQADFFAEGALAHGFVPGKDIWQLDAEDGLNGGVTGVQWQQFVGSFMDRTLYRLGARGFLYAGWYFVLAHGLQPHIAKYNWWLPAYGPNDGAVHPYPPGVPAELVVIHQFTSRLNGQSLDGNRIVNAAKYGGTPTDKVKPMYDPPIGPIAAVWTEAVTWKGKKVTVVIAEVAPNGDVYAYGVPFRDWPHKDQDFAGRRAAKIGPPDLTKNPHGSYTITATSGETYTP